MIFLNALKVACLALSSLMPANSASFSLSIIDIPF